MTKFYELAEMSAADVARVLPKEKQEIVGYPAFFWWESGPRMATLRLWPKPIEAVRILFDENGRCAGWVLKAEKPSA